MKVKKNKETEVPKNPHFDKRARFLLAELDADADGNELLDTKQLAELLEVSVPWLLAGRREGYGPPFERVFGDRIGYRRKALLGWLKQRAAEYKKRQQEAA